MSGPRTNAAFYAAPVEAFLSASEEEVYAPLASPHDYTLAPEQQSAWRLQLPVLRASPFPPPIFPILCATEARDSDRRWKPPHADGVRPPFCCNAKSLAHAIAAIQESPERERRDLIDPATWGTGSYSPTPTIIEAARSLYARHTVHDITRSDAGAVNLAATSGCIERIIAAAKAGRRKAVVFVTGVPGAGKTLVGLNVATRHGERSDAAHAVLLSGNGPRASHHFRDDMLRDRAPPDDHVVVFDEAQRAWDARQGMAIFVPPEAKRDKTRSPGVL